jgi:deazaflavin-dependent oxidoreductase (nitroreductase family)
MAQGKDVIFKIVTRIHRGMYDISKGKFGGSAGKMPVLKLITTGRKSGDKRITMLTAPVLRDDEVIIVASFGGDDRHPAWYLNLQANPDAEIELRGQARKVRARVAEGDERAELWRAITTKYANYAAYQTKTDRVIPVLVLEPR